MLINMFADAISIFQPKTADTDKWERFLAAHKEFIHTGNFSHERKGTHIYFDAKRKGKVFYYE